LSHTKVPHFWPLLSFSYFVQKKKENHCYFFSLDLWIYKKSLTKISSNWLKMHLNLQYVIHLNNNDILKIFLIFFFVKWFVNNKICLYFKSTWHICMYVCIIFPLLLKKYQINKNVINIVLYLFVIIKKIIICVWWNI